MVAKPKPVPKAKPKVTIELPKGPFFITSYVRARVIIPPALGIKFDTLTFEVGPGKLGGSVSLAREATFDPANPSVVLLCGFKPGKYKILARQGKSGPVVGEAGFALTDIWKDPRFGASKWFEGVMPLAAGEATWGGGPSDTPQNYNVYPAVGTRNLGVLFVDTADQRYTTDATTLNGIYSRWEQMAGTGFVGIDGVTRSTKMYYAEVSYGLLDIEVTVFKQVISLDGGFATYFDTSSGWPLGELATATINAATNAGLDLTKYDMLILVSQPVQNPPTGDPTTPPWIPWPVSFGYPAMTGAGAVTARTMSMPYSWGDGSSLDQGGGRTIYETLSHEFGHTLGLPDEYTPGVANRNLAPGDGSSWDPMAWEGTLPGMCLAHRVQFGWVGKDWIKGYNFKGNPNTFVDETVTISPLESGQPGSNQFTGVEVRIADGENYYFEYRNVEAGQIADQSLLPAAGSIVGTDMMSSPPATRPDILLLNPVGTDNGPVLATGQDYTEVDNTSPTFPANFTVTRQPDAGGSAVIRVQYSVTGKPDPSIRPWPLTGNNPYQSPDIQVHNPLADNSAMFTNMPWLDHNNTIVAKIMNRGTVSAPGVVARFYVKDFTVTNAPESLLGEDTHDLTPGQTADFSVNWTPQGDVATFHKCIIVRIDPYQTPTSPPVPEASTDNNVAQSNYVAVLSASSSPHSRERVAVTVYNHHPQPTTCYVGVRQSRKAFRTYLQHGWIRLGPHEHRRIEAMFEYVDGAAGQVDEKEKRLPHNDVALIGYLVNPEDYQDKHHGRSHSPDRIAGASVRVFAVIGTRLKASADGARVSGRVVTSTGQALPRGGRVIVTYGQERETVAQTAVNSDGSFTVSVKGLKKDWTATFAPPEGFGPAVHRSGAGR